jgi:hypothetical protein
MEDHESGVFSKEREEIDDILFCQPPLIKHNLHVEDLGTTLPIVLKTGPVIEPVRSSVQVFTGRTTGLSVHCLVF